MCCASVAEGGEEVAEAAAAEQEATVHEDANQSNSNVVDQSSKPSSPSAQLADAAGHQTPDDGECLVMWFWNPQALCQ